MLRVLTVYNILYNCYCTTGWLVSNYLSPSSVGFTNKCSHNFIPLILHGMDRENFISVRTKRFKVKTRSGMNNSFFYNKPIIGTSNTTYMTI